MGGPKGRCPSCTGAGEVATYDDLKTLPEVEVRGPISAVWVIFLACMAGVGIIFLIVTLNSTVSAGNAAERNNAVLIARYDRIIQQNDRIIELQQAILTELRRPPNPPPPEPSNP